MTNWSINLAVVNSLRSKLANKKVKGVFWPVVKSLWGVWAFFPFDWVKRAITIDDILKFGASTGLMVKPIKIKKKKRKKRCFLNLWQSSSIKDPYPILDQRDYWWREGVLVPMAFKNFRQSSNSFFIFIYKKWIY